MFCSSEHNVSCLVAACTCFLCAGSKSVVLVFQYVLRRAFLSTCRRVVRKSIARVLTVINQTQKENLRKFYKVSPSILHSALLSLVVFKYIV